MNFGARIKQAREARGLTQSDLAKLANGHGGKVTQQDITALERRDSARSIHAPALCQALGLDLHEMLTGEQSKVDHQKPKRSPLKNGDRLEGWVPELTETQMKLRNLFDLWLPKLPDHACETIMTIIAANAPATAPVKVVKPKARA